MNSWPWLIRSALPVIRGEFRKTNPTDVDTIEGIVTGNRINFTRSGSMNGVTFSQVWEAPWAKTKSRYRAPSSRAVLDGAATSWRTGLLLFPPVPIARGLRNRGGGHREMVPISDCSKILCKQLLYITLPCTIVLEYRLHLRISRRLLLGRIYLIARTWNKSIDPRIATCATRIAIGDQFF